MPETPCRKAGKLIIETGNIELDETYVKSHAVVKPGHYVMLSVSDSGAGIDTQMQAHIFEPFFTTKGKGKGTGLGLATVYGIVKQNGGNIWVYSEPGLGTMFKIYLPRIEGDEEAVHLENTVTAPPRGSETVLVVEDEMSVRRFIHQFLEGNGYQVLEAIEGGEGAHVNRCVKTLGSFLLRDLTSRNAIYIFHSSINVLHQLRSF